MKKYPRKSLPVPKSETLTTLFDIFMDYLEDGFIFADGCIEEIEQYTEKKFTPELLEEIDKLDGLATELFHELSDFRNSGKLEEMVVLIDKINTV